MRCGMESSGIACMAMNSVSILNRMMISYAVLKCNSCTSDCDPFCYIFENFALNQPEPQTPIIKSRV